MGYFLAVSAFKNQPVEAVAKCTASYTGKHGVGCKPKSDGQTNLNPKTDAAIYAPANGWTVVLWPAYFNIHDIEACRALSEQMQAVVATVHVYDDAYWTNVLFDQGRRLDQFASIPNYFEGGPEIAQRWGGDASVVARAMSVPEAQIAPYFAKIGEADLGKAFVDDEFELSNFWVFTDFWRRIGIRYPADVSKCALQLRLDKGFGQKLPTSGEL